MHKITLIDKQTIIRNVNKRSHITKVITNTKKRGLGISIKRT